MTVLVTATVVGDTEVFKRSLTEREEDYAKLAEEAQEAGAIHHRFGIVDERTVLISDEWDSAEAFRAFFARPELQQFMGEVGADISVQPTILIAEATESPDEF